MSTKELSRLEVMQRLSTPALRIASRSEADVAGGAREKQMSQVATKTLTTAPVKSLVRWIMFRNNELIIFMQIHLNLDYIHPKKLRNLLVASGIRSMLV
ncbi:MAG: hypothetical protein HOP27_01065 [Anaerolineales bacterium]|nr:hypothetical protein [Anaerolineales bacterium]